MSRSLLRPVRLVLAAAALTVAVAACSGGSSTASTTTTTVAPGGKPTSQQVLDKQTRTILDQLVAYPSGSQAQVSSAILTFAPGAKTGLHRHDAPLYVYVLEGTVSVTYDGGLVKEYSAGMGFLEAIGTAHDGENRTDQPVRLLVVNIGAEGVTNTVSL